MSADVVCTNTECPEFDVPKINPLGLPVADMFCGHCGLPVTEQGAPRVDE